MLRSPFAATFLKCNGRRDPDAIRVSPKWIGLEFFSLPEGKKKLKDTQWPLVERLIATLQPNAKKD